MGIGNHNEKNFVWDDIHLSTIFSLSNNYSRNSTALHTHPHYEMFLIESGNIIHHNTNTKIKCAKNTAVIIPPNTEHDMFLSEDESSAKIMVISFDFKKLGEHSKNGANKLYSYFSSLLSDKNEVVILKNKYFGDFCRRFYAESEADPTLASFIIINMIEELFLNVLRTLKTNYDKSNASSILSYKTSAITSEIVLAKNIEDYMNMPGCTLTVLADKLNMCPRNTQKIIKRIYGQSFSERQAEIRLKRAIYLIEKTDLSFTEIAKAVNYNQYASFRKAFINKFGVSPSEYKAKLT